MLAAMNGHTLIVQLLLADGRIDPDAENKTGNTALILAANGGHEGVLKLLLAYHSLQFHKFSKMVCNTRRGCFN